MKKPRRRSARGDDELDGREPVAVEDDDEVGLQYVEDLSAQLVQPAVERALVAVVELATHVVGQHDGGHVRREVRRRQSHPWVVSFLHLVGLEVAVEVEGVVAALAADAADPGAAEGRGEVAHQEAVDPDRAGAHGLAESVGAFAGRP